MESVTMRINTAEVLLQMMVIYIAFLLLRIELPNDSYGPNSKWDSCVMANDNNIYFIPARHCHVIKMGVKSGESVLIGNDLYDDLYDDDYAT